MVLGMVAAPEDIGAFPNGMTHSLMLLVIHMVDISWYLPGLNELNLCIIQLVKGGTNVGNFCK
ncbi:MAG: hypothetical protein CM15mP23_06810 [Cryomorphaceae bacterium]|nr:MAG: hypothetical protein CM15mP23_06810 [Cryomorphaceae bacterium]